MKSTNPKWTIGEEASLIALHAESGLETIDH